MNSYPKEPALLVSFLNTKLRDEYGSLDELCEDMDWDRNEIDRILRAGAFRYIETTNQIK